MTVEAGGRGRPERERLPLLSWTLHPAAQGFTLSQGQWFLPGVCPLCVPESDLDSLCPGFLADYRGTWHPPSGGSP